MESKGFFVVIRGPLGAGKTTIAAALANKVGAEHIRIDQILDEFGFDEWEGGYMSQKSFLEANSVAIDRARPLLERGNPVVMDGNFYWRSQIDDLLNRLPFRCFGFTLKVPLEECIERDSLRERSYGAQATRDVYAKSTALEWGTSIDGTRPVSTVVGEILSHLP